MYDFPDNPWALRGLQDMMRMPGGEEAVYAAGLDAKVQALLAQGGSMHTCMKTVDAHICGSGMYVQLQACSSDMGSLSTHVQCMWS